MMHEEFMKIAGYKVSYEDYKNAIEPMYMAMPDGISKEEFATMLDRSRFEVKKTEAELRQEQEYRDRMTDLCSFIDNNKSDIAYYTDCIESIKADIEHLKDDILGYKETIQRLRDSNRSYKDEIKLIKELLA